MAGTEYVIASIENRGKMLETKSRYLLFINTKTGETNRVDFSNDAIMEKVEQIKNDNLNLNVIVVSARTVDSERHSVYSNLFRLLHFKRLRLCRHISTQP